MRVKIWVPFLIVLILLFTSACSSVSPETPVAQPPALPPGSVATLPSAAETVPPPEGVDWLTVEGKTPDNLFYLGNPDAPVTLVDYSDFL